MTYLTGPSVERFVVRNHRYVAHSHDEFVISVNGTDVVRERVRLDRRRFDVGTAEVTIYNPGEVQASQAETRGNTEWECFSVHVDTGTVRELTGRDDIAAIRPVVADASLAATIRRIGGMDDSQMAEEATLWALGETLGRATDPARGRRALAAPTRADLGPILKRMRDDLSAPVRVSELSAAAGLSPDRFLRAFVNEVGVPPYAWHLHLRLLEGRRRLRAGRAPARVAAELGFADQAHFHRHFVAAYARTPGGVRARAASVVRR